MKKLITLTAILICAVLLSACAPGATPTADANVLATKVQQGIEQTLAAVTPTLAPTTTPIPTPTATSIPTKLVALNRDDSGIWQLYTIHSDGADLQRVTSNALVEGTFDYSPDNTKIAFETYLEDEQNSEIYLMQADGSGLTRLTHRKQNDWGPVWSPDGSKIIFQSNLGDANGSDYEIFVMNADGSNVINLSNSSGLDAYPVWSPDGSRIAFSAGGSVKAEDLLTDKNNSAIKILNADGSGIYTLPVLDGAGSVEYPQWSPDGSQILFGCGGVVKQTKSDGTIDLIPQRGICVSAADGSNLKQIYSTPVELNATGVNYQPYAVWSPDGSKILFVGQEQDKTTQLYTMSSDGSDLMRLTDSSEEMKCFPTWSPDGSMIIFDTQQGSLLRRKFNTYSMFGDGSQITLLAGPASNRAHPEWLD